MSSDNSVVETRWFEPGDAADVLRVYGTSFDRWPPFEIGKSPADYLEWFLQGFDEGDGGRVAVATVDAQVAAVGSVVKRPLHLRGEVVVAYQGSQWATDPEFQGRGLHGRLRRFAYAEPDLAWSMGFSQVAQVRSATRRLGDHGLSDEMGVYLRVLRPFSMSGSPVKRLGYGLTEVRGLLRRRALSDRASLQVRTAGELDEQWEGFEAEALGVFDFAFVRSAAFMNWRYRDVRAGTFTVRLAYDGDRLVGCCVSKLEGRRGHIVDLLTLPGRGDVGERLLDDAVELMAAQGASAVECWLPLDHPHVEALGRRGFVKLGHRSSALAASLAMLGHGAWADRTSELSRSDVSLHIMEADSDLI